MHIFGHVNIENLHIFGHFKTLILHILGQVNIGNLHIFGHINHYGLLTKGGRSLLNMTKIKPLLGFLIFFLAFI